MKVARLICAQSRSDTPTDQWLNENPMVLGLIAILIGLVLAGSGVYELRRGVARDKYGNEIRGGLKKRCRFLVPALATPLILFGINKMFAGRKLLSYMFLRANPAHENGAHANAVTLKYARHARTALNSKLALPPTAWIALVLRSIA